MPAYSIEEYLTLPASDQTWIWRGILPKSGSSLIYAEPKIGKTFVCLGLAEAIADESIHAYLGQTIDIHGKVLYIQLDTPRNLWRSGYTKLVSPAARKNIYTIDREDPDIPWPFEIRKTEAQDYLRHEVDRIDPVAVFVDTYRRTNQASENESDMVQTVLECFYRCLSPAAIFYISHARKMSAQGDMASTTGVARGSTALTGAVDSLIHMTKHKLTIAARSDVDEEIKIMQTDTGFYIKDDKADQIFEFVTTLSADMKERDKDDLISKKFGFSQRTARKYRLGITKGQIND